MISTNGASNSSAGSPNPITHNDVDQKPQIANQTIQNHLGDMAKALIQTNSQTTTNHQHPPA